MVAVVLFLSRHAWSAVYIVIVDRQDKFWTTWKKTGDWGFGDFGIWRLGMEGKAETSRKEATNARP
jgi:hypothetical protein